MNLRTRVGAAGAAALLVVGGAVPSYAAVTKDGIYNCAAFPAVQYRIQGGGIVLAPGNSSATRFRDAATVWRSGDSRGPGGFWSVTGNTTVDLSYTRGVCRNFG